MVLAIFFYDLNDDLQMNRCSYFDRSHSGKAIHQFPFLPKMEKCT